MNRSVHNASLTDQGGIAVQAVTSVLRLRTSGASAALAILVFRTSRSTCKKLRRDMVVSSLWESFPCACLQEDRCRYDKEVRDWADALRKLLHFFQSFINLVWNKSSEGRNAVIPRVDFKARSQLTSASSSVRSVARILLTQRIRRRSQLRRYDKPTRSRTEPCPLQRKPK